jgi:phospholipid/cholesterol/gamma-HCH transport system permease protein
MTGPLTLVGRNTLGLLRYASGLTELSAKTAYWTFIAPFRGRGLKWGAAIHQAVLVGYAAVPIVCVISFFVGMVLAFQGAYQLEKLGATYFVAALVGVSLTRELGPLMTAVVVAGRSGSAFAAEIGTMKVSEEIDALEVMGLNSIKYLVVPKYLAMVIMMPCLTLLADLAGMLGGASFGVGQLDQTFSMYALATRDALVMKDISTGLVKSVVFGALITTIGCYEGFTVRGGAEGVGRATTSAVVVSIFLVIVADLVFTAIFYYTG